MSKNFLRGSHVTAGAHEHILTAVHWLFTMAGYKTDCKHVPHSRGLKKADPVVKDFRLACIWDLIIDRALQLWRQD
jgi:hypothetical protein